MLITYAKRKNLKYSECNLFYLGRLDIVFSPRANDGNYSNFTYDLTDDYVHRIGHGAGYKAIWKPITPMTLVLP